MGDVYLFMDPSGNGNGIGVSQSGNGALYYTTDFGVKWLLSNINGTQQNILSFSSLFLSGKYAIAGTPAGYNLYNGIYYSENGGQTWTQSNVQNVSVQFVYMNGQYAIASTSSGVYYSSNYGQNWSLSNLVSNIGYFGSCITVTSSGDYYAVVATGNGLYYSTGNSSTPIGQTWTPVSGTSGIQFIAVAASNDPNNLQYIIATSSSQYGSTSNFGIWSSVTFGQKFKQVVSGIGLTNLAFSGQYALASSEFSSGLYYSSDYGQNWTLSPNANSYFVSMSLVGETALLYSISPYIQIYYTTNYGQNLSALTSPTLELQGQTALVFDGTNLHGCIGNMFVSSSGQRFDKAYYSSNPTVGSSWKSSTVYSAASSSAQGTASITSSASTSNKSVGTNLVTNTYTATATGTATGETYDKALEAAAKASLKSVVEVLYETARKESPGPIVSTALATATKAPRNNK